MLALEWRSFPRAAALFVAVSMAIYLILFLGLRFSLVNLTHMIIPLVFGTIGSALGLVTVFLANSALMLGGGYVHYRGAKK